MKSKLNVETKDKNKFAVHLLMFKKFHENCNIIISTQYIPNSKKERMILPTGTLKFDFQTSPFPFVQTREGQPTRVWS